SHKGNLDQAEPEDHTADVGTRPIPGKPTKPEQVPDEEDPKES
ncbi:hypothetical protein CTAM01_16919, partial [Colletotrichum tamarilloi]